MSVLASVQNVWAALSLVSALGGVASIALIAAGVLVLPGPFKRAAVALGVVLMIVSSAYQFGHVSGARDARELAEKRAADAETERVARAIVITRNDKTRVARDLAKAQADNRKLKELLDDARKNRDDDRVCVDRDLSRRLRAL